MLFNVIVIYLLYYGVEIDTAFITTLLPYFLIPVAFAVMLTFPLLWIISEVVFEDIRDNIKKRKRDSIGIAPDHVDPCARCKYTFNEASGVCDKCRVELKAQQYYK
jgi:uncharacterized paraquat-inducible protein A